MIGDCCYDMSHNLSLKMFIEEVIKEALVGKYLLIIYIL